MPYLIVRPQPRAESAPVYLARDPHPDGDWLWSPDKTEAHRFDAAAAAEGVAAEINAYASLGAEVRPE